MNLSKDQLTQLFASINTVIFSSGNKDLTVKPRIVLEDSEAGGHHRVDLMDALKSAVNGMSTITPQEAVHAERWFSDEEEFIKAASKFVAQYNN